MHEDLLHYVWRTRRIDFTELKTTLGEPIEILEFGQYNNNSGADFQNARIRINGIEWAGSIEMHLKASDWLQHQHQHDKAYKNVILHVVYEEDLPEVVKDVPCLELKGRIPDKISHKYKSLQHNEDWIPCEKHFAQVPQLTKDLWLERLIVERLERKTSEIAVALVKNRGDWEETFYQFIARNFGMKVNTEPMLWLAQSLPHLILAKHKNNLFQLEAIIFGQSGLLSADYKDEYPNLLKKEYAFLKHKHQLNPINAAAWKFARMRPAGFPTIRLAQLSGLVHRSSHLFSKILEIEQVIDLENLFDITVSDYWYSHYVFDTPSVESDKKLGRDTIDLILINTIVPFLFYYGKFKKEEKYSDKALQLLEQVKPEKNNITEGWQALGQKSRNAAQSQSLIELKTQYCDKKQCLRCSIGNKILNE